MNFLIINLYTLFLFKYVKIIRIIIDGITTEKLNIIIGNPKSLKELSPIKYNK